MNDSKSLNTIITLTKIAKVLSMIVFVLLIISTVACAISLAVIPKLNDFLFKGDNWNTFIETLSAAQREEFISVFGDLTPDKVAPMMQSLLICAVIVLIGSAVVAFLAYRYFKRVIEAGTPFTFAGANELRTLGIVSLAIALAQAIAAAIILKTDFSIGSNLAPGIAFLVVSVIFRHGAELREKVENASPALPFGGEQ